MTDWRAKFDELASQRPRAQENHADHERAFVRRKCRAGVVQSYEVCKSCRCFIRGPIRNSQAPTDLPPMTMGEIWRWLGNPGKYAKRGKFKSAWGRLYRRYLASPEWRAKRREIFELRGGRCEGCGFQAEQVHHLTYERVGAELPSDLMAICDACHRSEHAMKAA